MLSWISPNQVPMETDTMESYWDHSSTSSSRQQRNKAEKQRRDKLNNYITELATLVPMVAASPKRMDKTSVLRLSATYLRMYRCLPLTGGEMNSHPLPSTLESLNISARLLDFLLDMEGFMLIVNSTGKIVFVTHTVEKLLGHSQNDLLGQSLYSITCPEDHAELRRNLAPDVDPMAATVSPSGPPSGDDSSSNDTTSSSAQSSPSPRLMAGSSPDVPSAPPEQQRRSFYLHLSQRAVSRSDMAQYEPVHILGYLQVPRKPDPAPPTHTRSRKQRETPSTSSNDIVLVAVVQLFKEKRITDLSLLEASRDEYVTRHTKDGCIISSDHRISVVAGYMAEEVSGLSAFKFMHEEDVNYTKIALQQLYDMGEGSGSSCYRLMSKTGHFIYLRTVGYLEYNRDTQAVESFICINTLINEEEGQNGLQEMKKRYSASISSYDATGRQVMIMCRPSSSSVCALPGPPEQPLVSPVAIEDTPTLPDISHFISSPDDQNHSSQPGPNAQYVNVVLYSQRVLGAQTSKTETEGSQPVNHLSPVSPVSCSLPQFPVVTAASGIVSSTTENCGMERPTVLRESVITEHVSGVPVSSTTNVLCTTAESAGERQDMCKRTEKEENASSENEGRVKRWSNIKEPTVLKRTISLDLDSVSTSKRLHTSSRGNRVRRRESQPSPVEALKVEVPPIMSPDEQHQAIVMRGGAPMGSPLYNNSGSRGQTSPIHAQFGLLSGSGSIKRNQLLQSPTSPSQSVTYYSTRVTARSPTSSPQSPSINSVHFTPAHVPDYTNQCSPHSPAHSSLNFPHFNREQGTSVLSPASALINYQNPIMSPEQADSDTFSLLGLADSDNNPDFQELINIPLVGSVESMKPEFVALDNLSESFVEASENPDITYRGLSMTAEMDPLQQEQQVYSTMDKELMRRHLQLESRMQLQETQMNSIEQDLDQVPLAEHMFRTNLTQLQIKMAHINLPKRSHLLQPSTEEPLSIHMHLPPDLRELVPSHVSDSKQESSESRQLPDSSSQELTSSHESQEDHGSLQHLRRALRPTKRRNTRNNSKC